MRILIERTPGQAYHREDFSDTTLELRATEMLLGLDRFAHDLPDAQPWIQRTNRVLKDHLDVPSPCKEVPSREVGDVLTGKSDPARGRHMELRKEPTESRLPRSGFANETQGLSVVDLEGDAVDRVNDFSGFARYRVGQGAPEREVLHETVRLDERGTHPIVATSSLK